MPARYRPDWMISVVLAAVSIALVLRVGPQPDYDPGRESAPVGRALERHDPTAEGPPVQDFAYIFNYARFAAHDRGASIYAIPEHRRFLTAWLGPHISSALCFAYGPTTVLILAPLFPLATRWAWLVWNLSSVWIAALGIRSSAANDTRLVSFGRMALVSPPVFHCLVLGQTALLTTGLLAVMVLAARRSEAGTPRAAWLAAGSLFALTMKPPLAVVGAAALIAAGCWRPLVAAGTAFLVVVAASIAWWNGDLLRDYVALVGNYNLVDAPALIRAGFHPETMTNLRNVLLHAGLDDSAASRLTAAPLALCLALPAVLALRFRARAPLEPAAAVVAMGYALFSPHLSITEDLVLVPVMLWLWPHLEPWAQRMVAALCVGLQFVGGSTLVILARSGALAPGGFAPLVVFAAKVVLASLAVRALVASFRRADPAAPARA